MHVWFEDTVAVSVASDMLSVCAPKEGSREYIKNRLKGIVEEALSHHLSPTATLEIHASPT